MDASDATSQQTHAGVHVTRALLSVSNKAGIVEFATQLAGLGVEIVSTGGTARELEQAGIGVRTIADYTGFSEILDGRVKTLDSKLYAGLLAVRSNPEHLDTLASRGIEPIDLVCVNLYPFEQVAGRRGATEEEVIENIDIGGPTLIRAAAKNHRFAAVVVDPHRYGEVTRELVENAGQLSQTTSASLAAEAFSHIARYDAAIAQWFTQAEDFPATRIGVHEKVTDLSYGENPHQRAAYYAEAGVRTHLLSRVNQLHGKQLSYNNLLDLDSGRSLLEEFEVPAAVLIKHNNPCGCALAETIESAYEAAFACDPMSAFGGVFCLNRQVDRSLAEKLHEVFIEVLFAPGYDDEALDVLRQKPNIRIFENAERRRRPPFDRHARQVRGGILVQDRDADFESREDMEVVTQRSPTEQEWSDLLFAWKVCKHVRSNAIVVGRELATLGIGAGQMSRVDSVRLAIEKAQTSLAGAVMASDAFFPFDDGPQAAIDAGVRAVIQPGGSRRDNDVIAACDRGGVAMVFTGRRHFRH